MTAIQRLSTGRSAQFADSGGGGLSAEDASWPKQFFSDASRLPGTQKVVAFTGVVPTFSGVQSGSWTYERGTVYSSNQGLGYYDLGASFSKVLVWVSGMEPSIQQAIMIGNQQPAGLIPNAYAEIWYEDYFSNKSKLPSTIKYEEWYTFPAFDFTNLNGGSTSRDESHAIYTGVGPGVASFGWDIGALHDEILFGLPIRPKGPDTGLFLSQTQPAGELPANAFSFRATPFGGNDYLLSDPGGTSNFHGYLCPDDASSRDYGMLMYYKFSTGDLQAYVKYSGDQQWWPMMKRVVAAPFQIRYFGFRVSSSSGVTNMTCPLVLRYQ